MYNSKSADNAGVVHEGLNKFNSHCHSTVKFLMIDILYPCGDKHIRKMRGALLPECEFT